MKQTSSTTFQPDWLALREPADRAARDMGLLTQAAGLVAPGQCILDLGSGTGSTARAFAENSFANLSWRFLDQDPALLAIAKERHPNADTVVASLSDIHALPLHNVGLVTASALLDLMPASWIENLAARLGALGISFYGALNYNGLMAWTPEHADDNTITQSFNDHQQSDKGLGPALGPKSAAQTAQIFSDAGYRTDQADSPWRVGPDQAALNTELLAGIAKAAGEAGHPNAQDWQDDRQNKLTHLQTIVGHTDVLAINA